MNNKKMPEIRLAETVPSDRQECSVEHVGTSLGMRYLANYNKGGEYEANKF